MALTISAEELKLFEDYLREYSGLVFKGAQEDLFKKRILMRVEANSLGSVKDYYHFLRFDSKKEEEIILLLNLVTVNETYFFREPPQMEMLKNSFLPMLKESKQKSGNKKIRIWSAACSTGAEPYTMAILIVESGLFSPKEWTIEILGSDINTEALNVAKQGIYNEFDFRATDANIRTKYFSHDSGRYFKLDKKIIDMVKFSRINFFNSSQMAFVRDIDLILCRNALIYFDSDGKSKIVKNFYDSLAPGGFLLIGQTESLFKITTLFDMKPMSKVIMYQKPLVSAGGKNALPK